MTFLLLLLALAGDPATCPMHEQHMKNASVDERGDTVMGFSHEKTRHTFRLLPDGGAVEVRADDANDAESVAAIRTHLRRVAADFAKGDFSQPLAIHGRVPDGVAAMTKLGKAVEYRYEELERGGRVLLTTKDAAGVEAVHSFLKFQIAEHHTGDPDHVH